MESVIQEFLRKEPVGVLSVSLPDGTIHAAAMHFSIDEASQTFYFSTSNESAKYVAVQDGRIADAALVVGTSEHEWVTTQIRGKIRTIIEVDQLDKAREIHYSKHPGSKKFQNEPDTIFLALSPQWYRFTDFKTDPITVIEVDGKEST